MVGVEQPPRHSTARNVIASSGVVSPGPTPSSRSKASSTAWALKRPQQTFVQTSIVWAPTGSRWSMS